VDNALRHDFPPFHLAPATVVANATAQQASDVQLLAQRIDAVPGVAQVTPPRQLSAQVVQIDAVLANDPLAPASRDAVTSIRGIATPLNTVVGGPTAEFVDLQASLARTLPLAFAIIGVFTLVVLFAATGSVVLPVKALLMNVLSLSATFGILVLIFQDGRFQAVLGYTSQGALESTQPILLFALAFGLSTDYGVFLLTRIKESHDHGAANSVAVATGLERTGRGALLRRHRLVCHLGHHLHQGARRRHGACGADRRVAGARIAGAGADGAAGAMELVGSRGAAPAAPARRVRQAGGG
jgi:RND superfamily putative drug exporter